MKDFFKYVFATMLGIAAFMVLIGIFGAMSIVGMVASGQATTNVAKNSVFVLDLGNNIDERSETTLMNKLTSNGNTGIGLDDLLQSIAKAKENDNVKGIYLLAGEMGADSWASLHAIRTALLDFKKSGKWIVAYGDNYSQACYYLASAADKIYVNPDGMIELRGLAAQPYFLKDMMKKFGVRMQLAKVGTYKSMPEMYTADKMSDANREQVQAYLDGIWKHVVADISKSRGVSVEKLNEYADNLVAFENPNNYVKLKLADKLLYADQAKDEVKKLLGLDEDDDISKVGLADMTLAKGNKQSGEEIAVYYAYGDIVDSENGSPLNMGSHLISSDVVCDDLEKLAKDDNVKAVVLRVNSGGGSAYASEQIWHALKQLKAKKPLVVSMGGMAASGGYYISCPADFIVSEATTLTGSIGIFGLFPDVSELVTQKLGVKFDEVKTNRNAGFGNALARPINDEEMAYLTRYIERGYALFLSRVADGRKMSTEAVDKIAQGRVWTGEDALRVKLVDQLGGLDEAVAKAAQLAKLKEYYTQAYPGKKSWMDDLMSGALAGSVSVDAHMREAMGELYEPFTLLRTLNYQQAIQARVPFKLTVR